MIASLGMYDWPEMRAANDCFWRLIRDRLGAAGIAAPDRLTRTGDLRRLWTSPDLLLAQTCGLPLRSILKGKVTLVGTPDYGVAGCKPGYYRSTLVVRTDDPRDTLVAFDGARFAYNDALSQSGWAALLSEAAAAGIRPGACIRTGAHRASLVALTEGRADLAAIDSVAWKLARRLEPAARGVRVLRLTPPTPGLPLVSAPGHAPAPLFAAVADALKALPRTVADTLLLRGIVRIPAAAYHALPQPLPPEHLPLAVDRLSVSVR